MPSKDAPPLESRDKEVKLALDTLKSEAKVAKAPTGTAMVRAAFVP